MNRRKNVSEIRRGRPRKEWEGRLGAFVSSFRVESLAIELGVEPASVYGWMRGEYRPSIDRAFQIVEVARRSGTTLTLEDVYVRELKSTDEENHARILPKAAPQNRT
jgi:DNA-binding XRE family transcriptional regulator